MIITAQPFFNELDLLEVKCRTLAGVVDGHLIVEGTRTFTGQEKPMHYSDNRERFRGFPIIHRVAGIPHNADSPWERERMQYQAVRDAVRAMRPTIVIWLDADECPRPNVVERFLAMETECATLEMDHLLFYFDRIDSTQKWRNGKIGHYNPDAREQPWRGQTHWPVMADAGWHFEFFGGRETLLAKLDAVSHAPEPDCMANRERVNLGELPGLERTAPYPVNKLPRCVVENRARYANSFYQNL